MSTPLVIALNVILDVILLGGLAFAMSHARRLRPHEPAAENVEVVQFPTGLVAEVETRRAA